MAKLDFLGIPFQWLASSSSEVKNNIISSIQNFIVLTCYAYFNIFYIISFRVFDEYVFAFEITMINVFAMKVIKGCLGFSLLLRQAWSHRFLFRDTCPVEQTRRKSPGTPQVQDSWRRLSERKLVCLDIRIRINRKSRIS